MNKYLRSPLNYTGNKHRILGQILPYFPKKADHVVDLFCGGATVGINSNAKEVTFIDSEPRVIGLLQFLSKSDYESFKRELIKTAIDYSLSISFLDSYSTCFSEKPSLNRNNGLKEYNKEGFRKLKKDYNEMSDKDSDRANVLLYLLLVYGFNNDLRFNSKGEYNLPCGKTDLNKNNLLKIKEFISEAKKRRFNFICGDFRDDAIKRIVLSADFVYLDPPYLITDAVYNETSKWNSSTEKELIDLLLTLKANKIPFILSNVIEKNGGKIRNEPLLDFVSKNKDVKMINIEHHYRSSSYNKKNREAQEKEVILCYGLKND